MSGINYKSKIFFLLFLILAGLFFSFTSAESSGSSDNATLSVWTIGTPDGSNLTFRNFKVGQTREKFNSEFNFYFYANYTNESSIINNTLGGCSIRFNDTLSFLSNFSAMFYNSSGGLWWFNRSFSYRGNLSFEINCTSQYGNITLMENFSVQNTAPIINKTAGGYTSSLSCTEDVLCVANMSTLPYVQEDDYNDLLFLSFSANETLIITLTNYTFSSKGYLVINYTNLNQSYSNLEMPFIVRDATNAGDTATFQTSITAVNDAPYFSNLVNQTINRSILYQSLFYTLDEENNYPLTLNISFVSCDLAQWSTKTDCVLFNESQYSFNQTSGVLNISFIPSRHDVGNFTINFTLTDLNNYLAPYNSSSSLVVDFVVVNDNENPHLDYVCDNERNATEDSLFQCFINVSDIDELNHLNISVSQGWFLFNDSGLNYTSLPVNITTNYSASFFINFTPEDSAVGYWQGEFALNISVWDTGYPIRGDSVLINFNVSNVNDSVSLASISNYTVYKTNNLTLYINVSDDDLLIGNKNFYNESIFFESNQTNLVSIRSLGRQGNSNMTEAILEIVPNSSFSNSNHTINISYHDFNNYSMQSILFNVQILGNEYPIWNETTEINHVFYENSNFYLNLSKNVSDPDLDSLIFHYSNITGSFVSFSLDENTGVINFTPIDGDVGYHNISIIASDGHVNSSLEFNFTILNVNDEPYGVSLNNGGNATIANNNVTCSEAKNVTLYLYATDDDFKIPREQADYYNESLTVVINFSGPNENLFNFTYLYLLAPHYNTSVLMANFKPNRSDVGYYNLTINITDRSNFSVFLTSNITVTEFLDNPILESANDSFVYSIEEVFYYDFNVTDDEDGLESSGLFYYDLINLTTGGDFLQINETNGTIIFAFNLTTAGFWEYNLTVTDSDGMTDSHLFNLTVYDYPVISYPDTSFIFGLQENVTGVFNFTVNHTLGILLNYTLNYTMSINGVIKNSSIENGNGTPIDYFYAPNFTEQTTCSGLINISLNVSNAKLSTTRNWQASINNTDYPITLINQIGYPTFILTGSSSYTIGLRNYFLDYDASDGCINQTIGFVYNFINGTALTINSSNWTSDSQYPAVTFSSSSTAIGIYNINAIEYNESFSNTSLRNLTSNNFNVSLEIDSEGGQTTSTGTGGGGGGGGSTNTEKIEVPTPKLLKLILPESVEANDTEFIFINFKLVNDGSVPLNGISLYSSLYHNNTLIDNAELLFDISNIAILQPNEEKKVVLKAKLPYDLDGIFEVLINATVDSPVYSDWGKIVVTKTEGKKFKDKILFVDELIASNPECAEIKEILNEAEDFYMNGNASLAVTRVNDAINACRLLISQQANPKIAGIFSKSLIEKSLSYLAILSAIAIFAGFVVYLRKRSLIRKKLRGY